MGKEINKYEYSAKLVRVVDGDTCDALIDLGFDTWVKKRIRLKGEEKSLNQLLLENGHAYEYEGGKKKVFGS